MLWRKFEIPPLQIHTTELYLVQLEALDTAEWQNSESGSTKPPTYWSGRKEERRGEKLSREHIVTTHLNWIQGLLHICMNNSVHQFFEDQSGSGIQI